jgi:gamma-glutamylcyclotransferase (GGCT)/AIG2-like uncharacterized protein YtfP
VADYLFVYGTLRGDAGHRAAGMLARRAREVGPGRVRGRLYDLGAYPAAVRSPHPHHRVRGLVYRMEVGLREVLLADLDRYEGGEYRREVARVVLEDGESVQAWVYFYAGTPPPGREIGSGDYLDARDRS